MNFWQFKLPIRSWANEGSNEFLELEENDIYPQTIQDKRNEPRDNIGDVIFIHNTIKGANKKYPDGIYFICEVVSKIYLDEEEFKNFIKLKIIKSYKNNPMSLLEMGFSSVKSEINKLGMNGRLYRFEKNIGQEIFNALIDISEFSSPEEIPNSNSMIYEGSKKQIMVNAYERNTKARNKCIEQYGVVCSVCEFDFEEVYGEIGKGFIHVHHIRQLSEIAEKYIVDPIKDLRPVCPNCHAMLHKKKPAYTTKELKNILSK